MTTTPDSVYRDFCNFVVDSNLVAFDIVYVGSVGNTPIGRIVDNLVIFFAVQPHNYHDVSPVVSDDSDCNYPLGVCSCIVVSNCTVVGL